MIQQNIEQPYSQGFKVECEYSDLQEKSVLEKAHFIVGMRNESTGKKRHSHNEPIKTDWLPPEGLALVQQIDEAARELWNIMCDPEKYKEPTE